MKAEQILGIVAIGGLSLSFLQFIFGYLEIRNSENRYMMNDALNRLSRNESANIGIALLEGMWKKLSRYHEIIIPALINHAIFLLEPTKESRKKFETKNWLRIMVLLTEYTNINKYKNSIDELANAIDITFKEDYGEIIGLSKTSLEQWLKKLDVPVGGYYEDWLSKKRVLKNEPKNGSLLEEFNMKRTK